MMFHSMRLFVALFVALFDFSDGCFIFKQPFTCTLYICTTNIWIFCSFNLKYTRLIMFNILQDTNVMIKSNSLTITVVVV